MVSSELSVPVKLAFAWVDYFKVFFSWLFSFKRTFSITPGLYYTGTVYDETAPLLVTCNYHMTVFILWQILKKISIRLLVIDTDGINVWCSGGKGQFSAEEILKQVKRYAPRYISGTDKIPLVLPKLCLSGVSLAVLRKNGIRPLIGPVYARDIPAYLEDLPLKNRDRDKYLFSLSDRLFTLVPSLIQMGTYAIGLFIILFLFNLFARTGLDWQVIPIAVFITAFYILFFPLLPTKTFSIKGLALYAVQATGLSLYYFITGKMDLLSYLFYLFFLAGANLFYSLYYTGNSGVSNYSLVKKETIMFLPVTAVSFLGALVILIIKGVFV